MKDQLVSGATRLWELRYWLPVSPLGLALILIAVWVKQRWGTEHLDFVLHTAAMVTLLLAACAVTLVLVVALILKLHLRNGSSGDELQLETGVRAVTGSSFPRFIAWPMVQIRLEWAVPREVEVTVERTGRRLHEVVTPWRRGNHTGVIRRFVVADIFGLARFGIHQLTKQRVRIAPRRTQGSNAALLNKIGGEGLSHPRGPATGDLLDMRRYVYGDPLRHLLWKAYARSRQLLVRTAERAITPSPSAAAYMVAGRGDEPTASAARFFVEEGLLGKDFLFAADGTTEPTSDPREAVEQIIASVQCYGRGALQLNRFLDRVTAIRAQSLVVFVPPTPAAWLQRIERIAPRLKGATVVVALAANIRQDARGRLQRLLFAQGASQPKTLRGLQQVVHRLTRCGLQVKVLHHPSGETISPAALEAVA